MSPHPSGRGTDGGASAVSPVKQRLEPSCSATTGEDDFVPAVPRDLPVQLTLGFLLRVLPRGARLLEVGCGQGLLAAALAQKGFKVRGIDNDEKSAAEARTRGVDVVCGDFLTHSDDPFDAVLFTRSLHHIHHAEAALDRAVALLKPCGTLVAEEFARESIDRVTAAWFYDTLALLEAGDLLTLPSPLGSRVPDVLERWYEDHFKESLATGSLMEKALASRFELVRADKTVYLYRHFCSRLEPSQRGLRLARLLLETESREVEAGRFAPIGLRLVGSSGR